MEQWRPTEGWIKNTLLCGTFVIFYSRILTKIENGVVCVCLCVFYVLMCVVVVSDDLSEEGKSSHGGGGVFSRNT